MVALLPKTCKDSVGTTLCYMEWVAGEGWDWASHLTPTREPLAHVHGEPQATCLIFEKV